MIRKSPYRIDEAAEEEARQTLKRMLRDLLERAPQGRRAPKFSRHDKRYAIPEGLVEELLGEPPPDRAPQEIAAAEGVTSEEGVKVVPKKLPEDKKQEESSRRSRAAVGKSAMGVKEQVDALFGAAGEGLQLALRRLQGRPTLDSGSPVGFRRLRRLPLR